MHKTFGYWLSLIIILFIPGEAAAYSHSHCLGENLRWSGNGRTLRANSTSFPSGAWRNALQEAVDRLNLNPSNFNYGLTTDSGGVALGNNSSEVWGSTNSSILNGAPAIAYSYWTCYWFFGDVVHMDEVDIVFDYGTPWQWTTSTNKSNLLRYGGSLRPIQTTALHEMGHGLKLNHVNYEYNIMGTDFEHIHVNGSIARAYFGEDASDGIAHLYGTASPNKEDLGVVHWKYNTASGEYSDHIKTQLYDSSNNVITSTVTVDGEDHYRVSPGQAVRVQFSYENNGANTQSNVAVGFYVSTNSWISTWDTKIASTSMTLSRDKVFTTKNTVTVPYDLTPGNNYWLGAIIDDNGSLSEVVEWNNATYIPIRIKPQQYGLIEKERAEFTKLLIKNPNYFGTFPDVQIPPVSIIKNNTKYEEIKCIGFYPEQNLLKAVIDVKLPVGYKGNLCSPGSFEYVRFFVDWNGDGDFEDTDEDVGITSVNVHDIPDAQQACLDKTKPLSYAVSVKVDSKKKTCNIPNLVKTRAILSWETQPTAGNANYPPVWGNVVDKWIQIKPANWLLKDIFKATVFEKLKLSPSDFDLETPISKTIMLTPAELKEIYRGKNVPEHRFNFTEIHQIAEKVLREPSLMAKYKEAPQYSKLVENIEVILTDKLNTKYEELHCVGLNYDLDTLVATLTVKLPNGYAGGLCTKGSYEYVAFWADVYDSIEQQCVWKYLGTASVNVHDIASIPPEGLQYAVRLPVDFSSYKDKCSKPKITKIRGILSWQTPPPDYNPNYNPVWGNKVDKLIQIKPSNITMGQQVPYISATGGMAVEKISGNPDTVVPSALGSGYANGTSLDGGGPALESPFGSSIKISGHISSPPDDPADPFKLKYKVQYKKSGEATWHDITNQFEITISTWDGLSWSQSSKDQIATGGYYKYEEDLTLPVQHFVEDFVLAQWGTPVPEGDGLYNVRVLLYKPGAPAAPDVPADHLSSNVIKVQVDNTRPEAAVSLDAGPCTKFNPGDIITGKFTATDAHIWKYSLSVLPPVVNPPMITPSSAVYPNPALPAVNTPFLMTTTAGTTPCGYVIYLYVWDRTIVNNHMSGNRAPASVGLCLLEEK